MSETGGTTLRRWLLTAVADLGGSAQRAAVHAHVERLFGNGFTDEDRAPRTGRPGQEPAWKNNLDSLYDRLKKKGLMFQSKARGEPWRLSESGYEEVNTYRSPTVESNDLLADFKPNNGGEYRSHFKAVELMKKRDHDPLLEKFGKALSRMGWRPTTTGVHPRDLELRRHGELWLVEVKVIYRGNATEAVRAALAQLFEYRHYWYDREEQQPWLSALFSEPIGPGHVDFLETLEIASIWETDSGWSGSQIAYAKSLVPLQDHL